MEIIEDLRTGLTVSECNEIARILEGRKEGSVDGAYVKKVLAKNNLAGFDTLEGKIGRIAKYYFTLDKFRRSVIHRMINENTSLNQGHFEESIKQARREVCDVHMKELDRDSWYRP